MALAKDSKGNYIPLSTIYGRKNKDGSYTLSALDIKNLNDNLYAIAKKIQGGLTFADLTSEAGSNISDLNGNVSTLQQTSSAIVAEVSNLEARNTVTINANGLFVTDQNGNTTQLSGDHIKSGTIEGVQIVSFNGIRNVIVDDGEITFQYMTASQFWNTGRIFSYDGSSFWIQTENGCVLKLFSDGNLSIGANGTVYVGSDAAGTGDVYIGKANGGRIDLYGDVYINGVAYGS